MDARTRKMGGLIIAAVGVAIAVVGAFADQLGLGAEGADGLGTKQIVLLVAGLVLVAGGLVVALVLKDKEAVS